MKKWLLIVSLWMIVPILQAQDLGFDYVATRGDQQITMFGDREFIGNIQPYYMVQGWNPSGQYFMTYYDVPDEQSDMIFLNDYSLPESFPPFNETIISANYPAYFGDDRVIYIELTQDMLVSEDEQGLSIMRVNLYEWLFNVNQSAINFIGTIPYGVGCGGSGIRSALENVYSNEVKGDTSGEYNRKILVPIPYGIVHSNSCTAIRTYLTNPENTEFVELGDNLRWAIVSPDGLWVTGTNSNQLQLVDVGMLEVTPIFDADAPVYSVTWSDDSSGFYYVARTTNGDFLPYDDPDNVLATIEETLFENAPDPDDLLQWESTIYYYDFISGESAEIYRADAYAIGNMTWVDDTLVFNQIGHPTAWLQAIIDGGDPYDSSVIPVTLMQLDVNSGDITELADDLRGIWVRPR